MSSQISLKLPISRRELQDFRSLQEDLRNPYKELVQIVTQFIREKLDRNPKAS